MIHPVKIFDSNGNLKKICPAQSDEEILGSGTAAYATKNSFQSMRRKDINLPSYRLPRKPATEQEFVGKYSRPIDTKNLWDREKDMKVIAHILNPYSVSGKKMAREIGVSYDTFRWRVKVLIELNSGVKSINLARNRSRLDIDNQELMNDLKNKSIVAKDLAKKYQVSTSTICSWRIKINAT